MDSRAIQSVLVGQVKSTLARSGTRSALAGKVNQVALAGKFKVTLNMKNR